MPNVYLSFDEYGIRYVWVGVRGCVLSSSEKVKPLTVRVIAQEVMYARTSRRPSWVSGLKMWVTEWVPQRDWTMEEIRDFKRRIFSREIEI